MICETCKDCSRIITVVGGMQQILPCPECCGFRMTYCCEGEPIENHEQRQKETRLPVKAGDTK